MIRRKHKDIRFDKNVVQYGTIWSVTLATDHAYNTSH
jgi:hypothetical protein